jgi:hypothetical protein
MHLQFLDYSVVVIYGVFLLVLAQWVSREKAGHEKNTQDYFLAGRNLPWWAIGASLIAANISAEKIIVGFGLRAGCRDSILRMDGCNNPDNCWQIPHAGVFEARDLHDAAVFGAAL